MHTWRNTAIVNKEKVSDYANITLLGKSLAKHQIIFYNLLISFYDVHAKILLG